MFLGPFSVSLFDFGSCVGRVRNYPSHVNHVHPSAYRRSSLRLQITSGFRSYHRIQYKKDYCVGTPYPCSIINGLSDVYFEISILKILLLQCFLKKPG